jgi:hypothetical protein
MWMISSATYTSLDSGIAAVDLLVIHPPTFQALFDWVEKEVLPETLPMSFNDTAGTHYDRILCPYSTKTRLISKDSDVTKVESYECAL